MYVYIYYIYISECRGVDPVLKVGGGDGGQFYIYIYVCIIYMYIYMTEIHITIFCKYKT